MKHASIIVCAIMLIGIKSQAQGIQKFYNDCPCKVQGIPAENDDHTHYTIDEKNAYLSIDYDDADYSYEYSGDIAFTYFVGRDKQKVFAFSFFFDGPSSVSTDYAFYTIANSKWTLTDVLPVISVESFTDDEVVIDSLGADYRIQLELPQQGTDIIVRLHPVGENDAPFDYSVYLSMINSLPAKILKWNREKGGFEFRE